MADEEFLDLLNRLLIEVEDGKRGFTLAADECSQPEVRSLLYECALDCALAFDHLKNNAKALSDRQTTRKGGTWEAVRQDWTGIKSAAFADQVLATLESVEHGYARIELAFGQVLDAKLPGAIRHVVEREKARVGRNPARLSRIREAVLAGATSK